MFASTFIFRAGQYDEEFHRLDQQIAEAARAIPGYGDGGVAHPQETRLT